MAPLKSTSPVNVVSPLNVLFPAILCVPLVLTTVLSTAKLLEDAIVPPPLNPSPAVSVTVVWSIFSLAT